MTHEKPTWNKEPYKQTFSRSSKFSTPEDIMHIEKVDEETAGFRAATRNLSVTSEIEKDDEIHQVHFERSSPFSPVSLHWHELGIREQLVITHNSAHKRIEIPKPIEDRLSFFPQSISKEIGINEIAVQIIAPDDINNGYIQLPTDTWNLDNFNQPHYKVEGIYAESFLNKMNALFKRIKDYQPNMELSSVCVSKAEKKFIILPKISHHGN